MKYRPRSGSMMPLFLFYCAFLAVGIVVLTYQAAPLAMRFKAAGPMSLNHLVQAGDLLAIDDDAYGAAVDAALAKLTGRYAQSPIHAGQLIDDRDFAPAPLLIGPPNQLMVGLPISGGAGNAGMVYHVCKLNDDNRSETPVIAFEAGAVLCGKKPGTACTAIAYLTVDDARTLMSAMPGAGLLAAKTATCTTRSARPIRPADAADPQ